MENAVALDNVQDEVAAKNRFESFKLGKGLPSSVAQKRHSHARSHSRNASVSSSVSSLPFSVSKSTNSVDMTTPVNLAPPSKRNSHHRRRSSVSTRIESAELMGVSIPDLPPSTSEDNINLGEKDSIRRRALWALEGKPDMSFSKVEIPELSTPAMEKMMYDFSTKPSQPQNAVPSYGPSINSLMGNKRDSFKLLGASSSSKDQLHTLVEEEEEEEEDTSKSQEVESTSEPAAPATPITPSVAITKATPVRPRPANLNLNLRPLSLTPENLVSMNGLPTPSLTPSPRLGGLKSLALVPAATSGDSTNVTIHQSTSQTPSLRRLSLNLNASSESPSPAPASSDDSKSNRRSSILYKPSNNGVATNLAGLPTPEMTPTSFDRRYSMSFPDAKRRRNSTASASSASISGGDGEEESFPSHPTQSRPLSASEQHFLFKSHNALLARITDLERALSTRRRSSGGVSASGSSRPVSVASDFSYSSEYGAGEPSDEMLRLVADLKGERDELKRDVDGWRTRVGDMEKQLGVVAGRVEAERRDAWVARSMAGLLEVEKGALEKKLADSMKDVISLQEEKTALEAENGEVKSRVASLEDELERVKQELFEERRLKREEAAAAIQEILTTPTPRTPESRPRPFGFAGKRGHGFPSVDSESSITDVEDSFDDSNPKINFSLKAVDEDDEDVFSEEDNGLAGYEDEEESDVSFHSSSSFGSEDDFPRSVSHLQADALSSVVPKAGTVSSESAPVIHAPRPTHAPRASLSKKWTFPMGAQLSGVTERQEPEADRFFGCLQDDEDNGDSAPASPSAYSYEKSKGLFASGFKYGGDEEDAPFFFPLGAGVQIESPQALDAVPEEEEDKKMQVDDDMFGEAGGIQITFTPPAEEDESFESQRSPSPVKPSIPILKFFDADYEEEDSDPAPFNFGRPLVPTEPAPEKAQSVFSPPPSKPFSFGRPAASAPLEVKKEVVSSSSVMITPPSSLPRPSSPRASSPSSIPRATSIKPFKLFSFPDMSTSTPPRAAVNRAASNPHYSSNAFVTPPNKRGGAMPSFIPQPISSPSPLRSVSAFAKPKAAGLAATSVRPPQRKPLMLANNISNSQNVSAAHGSTFAPQPPTMLEPVMNASSLRSSRDIHAAPLAHSVMKSIDLSDHFGITSNLSSASTNTTPTQTYPYSVPGRTPSSSRPPVTSPVAEATIPSSSFSSIMTSPLSARLTFQTFTNFIPMSWSQVSAPPPPVDGESAPKTRGILPPTESASQQHAQTPSKRGFVSKEKQLEKLRSRLEREGTMKMKTSVTAWCDNCDEEAVAL
ncbi:hypothetical protein DXG03_007389 [Asterophora parasitica]|uniref:Uncharacterized protein n=1 Tax=Asterophora parasitica TaxID=117018 RepID=A0A9P7KD67_9AGAR|nr:hypothetical protein DXG03_007389 [Asterophora parasitica]